MSDNIKISHHLSIITHVSQHHQQHNQPTMSPSIIQVYSECFTFCRCGSALIFQEVFIPVTEEGPGALVLQLQTVAVEAWSPGDRQPSLSSSTQVAHCTQSPIIQGSGLPSKFHSMLKIMLFSTLKPGQNGCYFPDNIFQRTFLHENVSISIKISLKFVPRGPISNIPALVQIMAWRRPGDKPLSEPMMVSLLTYICVTGPQWVNSLAPGKFKWNSG